jgi:hypothetical protein
MKKTLKIPTDEQLSNIAQFISDELADTRKDNVSIVFEIPKDLLKQVDENYFYKQNKNADDVEFIAASEVNINISGISFKFIESKDDQEKEEET